MEANRLRVGVAPPVILDSSRLYATPQTPCVSVEFPKDPAIPALRLLFAPFQVPILTHQGSLLPNNRQHQPHTSLQTTKGICRTSPRTRMSQIRRGPRRKVPIQPDLQLLNASVSCKKPPPPNRLAQKPTYRLETSALCIQTEATKSAFSSIMKGLVLRNY